MAERKSGAGICHRGYEEDVASDSSNLWSDESGDSGVDEIVTGGGTSGWAWCRDAVG